MTVRAKFLVKSINHIHCESANEVCAEVILSPVYGNNTDGTERGAENNIWSKYTPQGECKMMITNPAAIEEFSLGQEFYLDFTTVK